LPFGQIYPIVEGAEGGVVPFLKSFFYNKRERERDSEFMLNSVCKNRTFVIGSILPFLGGFVNTFFKNLQGQRAQGLWENSAGVRLRTLTALYAII
jgi:hypothetical protein